MLETIKQALSNVIGSYTLYYDADGSIIKYYDIEYICSFICLMLLLTAGLKILGWIIRGTDK